MCFPFSHTVKTLRRISDLSSTRNIGEKRINYMRCIFKKGDESSAIDVDEPGVAVTKNMLFLKLLLKFQSLLVSYLLGYKREVCSILYISLRSIQL